jgi:hypothetical protein
VESRSSSAAVFENIAIAAYERIKAAKIINCQTIYQAIIPGIRKTDKILDIITYSTVKATVAAQWGIPILLNSISEKTTSILRIISPISKVRSIKIDFTGSIFIKSPNTLKKATIKAASKTRHPKIFFIEIDEILILIIINPPFKVVYFLHI